MQERLAEINPHIVVYGCVPDVYPYRFTTHTVNAEPLNVECMGIGNMAAVGNYENHIFMPMRIGLRDMPIPDEPDFLASLVFEWDDVRCEFVGSSVMVRSRAEPMAEKKPVGSAILRKIKYEDYRVPALFDCVYYARSIDPKEAYNDAELIRFDFMDALRSLVDKRNETGKVPESMPFARLFCIACAITRKPSELLANAFGVTTMTINNWVKRARADGYYTGFTRQERDAEKTRVALENSGLYDLPMDDKEGDK
ncbi:MAG: hypothetical protein UHD09_06075 [Bifidobacterium sp.]|nr:hypothetical protein [Bifidobacterium sp.]